MMQSKVTGGGEVILSKLAQRYFERLKLAAL
jgi:hypothetical protein